MVKKENLAGRMERQKEILAEACEDIRDNAPAPYDPKRLTPDSQTELLRRQRVTENMVELFPQIDRGMIVELLAEREYDPERTCDILVKLAKDENDNFQLKEEDKDKIAGFSKEDFPTLATHEGWVPVTEKGLSSNDDWEDLAPKKNYKDVATEGMDGL